MMGNTRGAKGTRASSAPLSLDETKRLSCLGHNNLEESTRQERLVVAQKQIIGQYGTAREGN